MRLSLLWRHVKYDPKHFHGCILLHKYYLYYNYLFNMIYGRKIVPYYNHFCRSCMLTQNIKCILKYTASDQPFTCIMTAKIKYQKFSTVWKRLHFCWSCLLLTFSRSYIFILQRFSTISFICNMEKSEIIQNYNLWTASMTF